MPSGVDDCGMVSASSLGLPNDKNDKKSVAIRTANNDVGETSCLNSLTRTHSLHSNGLGLQSLSTAKFPQQRDQEFSKETDVSCQDTAVRRCNDANPEDVKPTVTT